MGLSHSRDTDGDGTTGVRDAAPAPVPPLKLAGTVAVADKRLPPAVLARQWAWTGSCPVDGTGGEEGKGNSGGWDGIGVGDRLDLASGHVTVMSFNILADRYCTARMHPCEARYRKWQFRRWKVLREIETHACDFVGLQEVRCLRMRDGGGGGGRGEARARAASRGMTPRPCAPAQPTGGTPGVCLAQAPAGRAL